MYKFLTLSTYNKYILFSLLKTAFILTSILSGITWLTQSLRYFNIIMTKGLSILEIVNVSILLIPYIILLVLPFVAFISVLYVYHKMAKDNELIVLRSLGLNNMDMLKPVIILSTILVLIGLLISLYLQPFSMGKLKEKLKFIYSSSSSSFLEAGVFNYPIKNITIFIKSKSAKHKLKGILIHDGRNPEKALTIIADEGELVKDKQQVKISIKNGHFQEINKAGELTFLHFTNSIFELNTGNIYNSPRTKDAQERFITELLFPQDVPAALINKLKSEAHHRILWPFYSLVLAIIAGLSVLMRKFNRQVKLQQILMPSIIAIAIIVINLILNHLNAKIPNFVPISYVIFSIYLIILCYITLRPINL